MKETPQDQGDDQLCEGDQRLNLESYASLGNIPIPCDTKSFLNEEPKYNSTENQPKTYKVFVCNTSHTEWTGNSSICPHIKVANDEARIHDDSSTHFSMECNLSLNEKAIVSQNVNLPNISSRKTNSRSNPKKRQKRTKESNASTDSPSRGQTTLEYSNFDSVWSRVLKMTQNVVPSRYTTLITLWNPNLPERHLKTGILSIEKTLALEVDVFQKYSS
jgi:hypothetical protein